MLIEAVSRQICYRLCNGDEVRLRPGMPQDLPASVAISLLTKAAGHVRLVQATMPPPDADLVCEPVAGLQSVYWESQGIILGPGTVSCVAMCGTPDRMPRFWLCVEFENSWSWIRDILLRSKAAFAAQPPWYCRCCGGTGRWKSRYGVTVCRRCYPPMHARVVQAWLDGGEGR